MSVSASDLEEMRNECTIEVKTYESLFEENVRNVRDIEQRLILSLLNLLPEPENLPSGFYTVFSGLP